MADYTSYKFGGVQTPLAASTTNELLQDADPSIFYMCDFLSAMLTYHLGARFAAEAAVSNIPGFTGVLADTVPFDPAPFLVSNQFKFPLLAIYRIQDTETEHTRFWMRSDADVAVMYILPPITAGDMRIIGPILNAVRVVMLTSIERGFHPSYTPPGAAIGTSAWVKSEMMGLQLKSSRTGGGVIPVGNDKLFFPAWQGVVTLKERTDIVRSDYLTFAGSDVHEDLHDPAGIPSPTVTDVVVMATDVG